MRVENQESATRFEKFRVGPITRTALHRMSFLNSTAKENGQMNSQPVMRPESDSREPEFPKIAFERVLNSDEAAALLQIHPKTLQRMARQGSVPAFRIGDLWRFRALALDEWLRSVVSSKGHSCR